MPALLLITAACATLLLALALPLLAALRLLATRLPPRARALARLLLLLAAYIATFECPAILAATRLRARGRLTTPALGHPCRTPAEQHLERLTGRFFQRGFQLAGLGIHRDAPPPDPAPQRPVLVIARHAGFLNAQLLTHEVFRTLGRRTMAITKLSVKAAPGFGALVPGTFITPYRWTTHGRACALRRMITMARYATPEDGLVLFPEGTNITATRRRAAIDRLHAEEHPARADRYHRLHHVLPPQATGVRVVLRAMPGADVLFFAHTGLEDLLAPLVDLGYPPLADGILHTTWWHVPAEQIPREQAAFEAWLDDWWQTLDEWTAIIRTRPAAPAPRPPARPVPQQRDPEAPVDRGKAAPP
ncbi:hypothetical protein ACFP1Z_04310 [Streptomyces gamaensis]|uniref:Phospholipid/glycerol acyltransferase domain-containing protein n=1 Tax=Streptomyces gamaensis TaxID=1763542 RepID=A0ABW0YXL8_9ACTN